MMENNFSIYDIDYKYLTKEQREYVDKIKNDQKSSFSVINKDLTNSLTKE